MRNSAEWKENREFTLGKRQVGRIGADGKSMIYRKELKFIIYYRQVIVIFLKPSQVFPSSTFIILS